MAKQADKDSPAPKFARKGTTLWLCIVFFVSAWMFVLGVLVGRGTAPVHFDIESLQKELVALKEAVQKKEQEWYKDRFDNASDKPDLEFHEALKKNRVDLQLAPEAGRSAKPAQKTYKIPVSEIKKSPAHIPEPAEERKSAAVANQPAVSFTIQVAALREAKFADLKVAELSRRGYPAYRIAGTVPGQGVWHRVRIGSFKDKIEATRMLEKLKTENIKGIIVQK